MAKQTGEIELNLDHKLGCEPTILLSSYTSLESGDNHFKGNVLPIYDVDGEPVCECNEGEVLLYQTGTTFSGVIYIDDRTFELRDVGENVYFLAERSPSQVAHKCGLNSDEETELPEEGGADSGAGLEARTRCHPIRVLVLYDDSALALDPNIEATAARVITGVNDIMLTSGAFSAQVSYQIANVLQFNMTQSSTAADDRDFMETDANVNALRTANSADLILYFVDASWGFTAGIANRAQDPTRAVALVKASTDLTKISAHELGHLLTCRHESSNDPIGPFQHAYEFKTGCWPFKKQRNTIMWSSPLDKGINRFSNPNRNYKGEPYGTTTQDNVRQLIARGCAVAEYDNNNGPQIVTALIDGLDLFCPCAEGQLAVRVACPPGLSLSFEWRQSSDGVNYGSVYSTSETISVTAPCTAYGISWYRVEIFDASGQLITTAVKSVMAEPCRSGPGQELLTLKNKKNQQLFPTVGSGVFTLKVKDLELSDNLSFTVTSSSGSSSVSVKTVTLGNQHEFQFDFSALPSGIYMLKSNRTNPMKFVIQ
ncbi:MAG: hypothetical protein AB8F78_09575 [Saprospiraceae bacterium]